MNVLFCASEVVPFAKTGGLADVAGALPVALEKLGLKMAIALPGYKGVTSRNNREKIGRDTEVFFIENHDYFHRDGLYGDKTGDYPDNLARFVFYCKKTLELLKELNFRPDIIHCHDWQSALIPLYLKTIFKDDSFYQGIKTVLTIHNLGYQGLAPRGQFPLIGVGEEYFTMETLEFYGKVSPLKAGILYSDALTTVSPTYSQEIQTPEFGYGLEGLLFKRGSVLSGILNGIDYQKWNPATDKSIAANYSKETAADKIKNKLSLQKEAGFKADRNVPFLGIITRLADQKGLDLLAGIIDRVLKLKVQFILLGTGEEKYHILFGKIAEKYPGNASINLRFDPGLARRIYAGCDLFLMPSRYEPCGLGQMICLRYGTIPVVRSTGGLADTISEYNPESGRGNGFCFQSYEKRKFLKAVKRALLVYRNQNNWRKLVRAAMEADLSWDSSARKYLELYQRLVK